MLEEDEVYIGEIRNVVIEDGISRLYIETPSKTEKILKKSGELQARIGYDVIFNNKTSRYRCVPKSIVEEVSDHIPFGSKLGEVIGDSTVSDYSFVVSDEKLVYPLAFVGAGKNIVGRIMNVRQVNNEFLADVAVDGEFQKGRLQIPRLPLKSGSTVKSITDEALKKALRFKEDGLYLGHVHKTPIKFYADIDPLFNQHTIAIGMPRSGKSYAIRTIIEGVADRGIPCVIFDSRGEHEYSFENDVPEELEKAKLFGVTPKSYASNFLKFSFRRDSPNDVVVTADHFRREEFYSDFLVKEGQISVVSAYTLMQKDKQINLLGALAEGLFNLRVNKRIPPLLLVVEDAERYIPEGKDNLATIALSNIAFMGSKDALSLMMSIHSIAETSKSVTRMCKNYLVFQTQQDIDIARLKKTVVGVKQITPILQQMQVGTCLMSGDFIDRPFLVDVRPARSKHFGQSVSVEDKLFDPLALKKTGELQKKVDRMV